MRRTGSNDRHVRMQLGAFLLGGLTPPEAAAISAHLSVCAKCRAEHDELACVPAWLDLLEDSEPGPGDEVGNGQQAT
jgi:anti-sigma factor ChrR (cupin superfamily)